MIPRKTIGIGGAIVVMATILITLFWDKKPPAPDIDSPEALLEAHDQLLVQAQQHANQDCADAKAFLARTAELQKTFDTLRQRKHDLFPEGGVEEFIPPIPGSEPLDMSDEVMPETPPEEYIPKPGQFPLDLDGNSVPGEEPEFIPPVPWTEPLDMGDEVMPETSQEYIPEPGDQPLDLVEKTTRELIDTREQEIKDLMTELQSKCEGTNKACDQACNNYNKQCLSLVPNVDQNMLSDWFASCMDLCKDRPKEKITCMQNAQDCVAMTEVCGL